MRTPDAARATLWTEAYYGNSSRKQLSCTESESWLRHENRPFAYREPSHQPMVADLYGRSRVVSFFRRGGESNFRWTNDPTEEPESESGPDADEIRARNQRDVLATITRYEASGRFSQKELARLVRLWLWGWTLQKTATAEGVSKQAIRVSLVGNRHGHGGLLKKAPEFARWWAFRNRNRARKR